MHCDVDSCLFLNHVCCVRVLMVLRVLIENTGVSCVIATSYRYSAFWLLLQTLDSECQIPVLFKGSLNRRCGVSQSFHCFIVEVKSKVTISRRPYHFFTDNHQHCAIDMRLLAYIPSNGYVVAVGHKAPYRDIHGGGIAPYAHSQSRTTRS